MRIYDLSHKLNNDTLVYPGNKPPRFASVSTLESKGYRETQLDFYSHVGTHIDAPAHILTSGKFLDELDISAFSGKALIIKIKDGTDIISKESLLHLAGFIKNADFILFNTGWSNYWGTDNYFTGFPVLGDDALKWLLTFELKGIGFDTISADAISSIVFKNHLKILEYNMIIIENLNFPEQIIEMTGEFFCFPLPFENADGSPVRAVLKSFE